MIKYIITLTLTRFRYYIIRNNTYGGLTAHVVGLEIFLLLVRGELHKSLFLVNLRLSILKVAHFDLKQDVENQIEISYILSLLPAHM